MSVSLPVPPREPTRAPFPVIAVVAPLVAAAVIGFIIRSPYVLVFAALSPVIALASVLESRRTARRERRDERERFARECAGFEAQCREAQAAESAQAIRQACAHARPVIGTRPGPSGVCAAVAPPATSDDPAIAERMRQLATRAATNPRMPVLLPDAPVVVRGAGPVAERLRTLVSLTVPSGAEEGGERGLGSGHDAEATCELVVSGLSAVTLVRPGHAPERLAPVIPFRATLDARRAREAASSLPAEVRWSTLPASNDGALTVGVAGDGPFGLDLVADGPHVIVGGATGSGKSEFLRALALSAARDPQTWSVLFVDFKGGATFHDLRALAATVGLITDLDAAMADRALGSLRAEIRRRERVLRDHGVRDITALDAGVSERRLLIMVDEYAAMVDAHPALQAVFTDISARGRSLGLHLVLCTQRPAGVVHDAVAVNCAIRVLFRTTDGADARALLGSAVGDLDAAPRGRAQVRVGGDVRAIQVALVGPGDAGALDCTSEGVAPARPWTEPLPDVLTRDDPRVAAVLAPSGAARDTLIVGVADVIDEQRWAPALWSPRRDGALAVLGCPGSGRTTALAALADDARRRGWAVQVIPSTLADAVHVLRSITRDGAPAPPSSPEAPPLIIADGLGDLVAASPPELAAALCDQWDAAVRVAAAQGGGAAADLGSATSAVRVLSGRFGARLILRAHDDEEHRLAGGPRGAHDHRAPAGRGWWRGTALQVLDARGSLLAPLPVVIPRVADHTGVLAIVSAQPDGVLSRLSSPSPTPPGGRSGGSQPWRAAELGALASSTVPRASDRVAIVAHPDEWQRDYAALSGARRSALIVLDGLDTADVRALIGPRAAPPPIDRGEVWLVAPGQGSAPRIDRGRW